jgi:hypothetical protein
MEREGSQELTTGLCPEPDASSPTLMLCFFTIGCNVILSSAYSFLSSLQVPTQNFVCISHLPRACCIPRLSRPPWFYRRNYIW